MAENNLQQSGKPWIAALDVSANLNDGTDDLGLPGALNEEEVQLCDEMEMEFIGIDYPEVPRDSPYLDSEYDLTRRPQESRDGRAGSSDLPKSEDDNHDYGVRAVLIDEPQLFIQLNELTGQPGSAENEWRETARWIIHEENVEDESDRWGKPHLASLSFHSLLNLRKCLETGIISLDLNEKDLFGAAYRIVEQMAKEELITDDNKPVVMRSLLLPHRHPPENKGRFRRFSISASQHSSYASVENLSDQERSRGRIASIAEFENTSINGSAVELKNRIVGLNDSSHEVDIEEETYTASAKDVKRGYNESLSKRLPEGSEAAAVLVGDISFLDKPTVAFVRLAQAVPMPTLTEVNLPVRFMFICLGPENADLDYYEVGRSISTLLSMLTFQTSAYKAESKREILSAINQFLDDCIVLPSGNWAPRALLSFDELNSKSNMIRQRKQAALDRKDAKPDAIVKEQNEALLIEDDEPPTQPPNPLERTGKLFGGLINDIKRRYPFYVSDLREGLNAQCLAAAIFMFFAALSSAITFGGLYGDKTNNLIGISETLISGSFAGIVFALTSGQPMMVVGATGPLLLFDSSLFMFCESSGIDFLGARCYIALWMLLISLVIAAFEGSVMVKLFTRFTEDIFALLISLIFIMEPLTKNIDLYYSHPLYDSYCSFCPDSVNSTISTDTKSTFWKAIAGDNFTTMSTIALQTVKVVNQPNTALFSTVLCLGTFIIAYYLRIFRNGHFLGRLARRALGDFGVPIAIILMVTFANLVPQVYTDKLSVPEGLSPSSPQRGWLIGFNGISDKPIPIGWVFALLAAALMVFIIIFMETHIAELIVDKTERKLKKGSGFHMDIVLLSFINVLCAFIGAPWQCVATVRSVSHVSALTVMSKTHAPGDKPYITEVKEQRLSGFVVSILIGASVTMAAYLRLVPVAVLLGVFLYMGISSITGIQLFNRVILFAKPVKHHPQVPYVRFVPTLKMHLFTLIQVTCLAILWTVKSSFISMALPFFLILMVPLRCTLSCIFTPNELIALDGKNQEMEEEPDFYEEAPLPG